MLEGVVSADAWASVLGVERAVWGVVNRMAPFHFDEDDKREWVHDVLMHLHAKRADGAYDTNLGGWVNYAVQGAQWVCRTNWDAHVRRCRTCARRGAWVISRGAGHFMPPVGAIPASLPFGRDAETGLTLDAEESPSFSAERCGGCDRALRSRQEAERIPLDKKLEARKHSAGLCGACAKRRQRAAAAR